MIQPILKRNEILFIADEVISYFAGLVICGEAKLLI